MPVDERIARQPRLCEIPHYRLFLTAVLVANTALFFGAALLARSRSFPAPWWPLAVLCLLLIDTLRSHYYAPYRPRPSCCSSFSPLGCVCAGCAERRILTGVATICILTRVSTDDLDRGRPCLRQRRRF